MGLGDDEAREGSELRNVAELAALGRLAQWLGDVTFGHLAEA